MDLIASKNGSTSFQILFDKHDALNEVPVEEYQLTLAAFSRTPKIDFGRVKCHKQTSRLLTIQNAQEFDVDLNITCKDLQIDNLKLNIPKKESVHLNIKWQPESEGNHKYSILIEVTNAARLKFLVHAFGVCVCEPQASRSKPRKPLAVCQPVVSSSSSLKSRDSSLKRDKKC